MTVTSLWKVLDKAACGTAVGANEIASFDGMAGRAFRRQQPKPISYRERLQVSSASGRRTALAVDLSIWICESLSSHALKENHTNPHLHLVFSRTVKLLSLGIKLVFVVEGKRRVRSDNGEDDKFHKRRRGTSFWNACKECQQLLEYLGVPVVRAKAEGEALCALLNAEGIVDGVISNDGDCLLFGARTIYTKFSLENLENKKVIRYDLERLRGSIESNDKQRSTTISLSRSDLLTFAILTGSDMVGCGLDKVGSTKALRFIRKCKLDFPLTTQTAALDELQSWSRVAAYGNHELSHNIKHGDGTGRCSRCCHTGTKRNHAKHGCDLCGTNPGELCFDISSDDKFRDVLREKVIKLQPLFDPSQAIKSYMRPNDNQIPLQLAKVTSETMRMSTPRFIALSSWRIIVKGRSLEPSRQYVMETVARLLSRSELFLDSAPADRERPSHERPVPQLITKMLVHNQQPCYEILWTVSSTVTDDNGENLNSFQYLSVEQRALFDARFNDILPRLLSKYDEAEKERKKQGDAEQCRRRDFLDNLMGDQKESEAECNPPHKKVLTKSTKKRQGFFQGVRPNPQAMANIHHKKIKDKLTKQVGDDVLRLLGMMPNMKKQKKIGKLHQPPNIDIDAFRAEHDQEAPLQNIKIKNSVELSPMTRCTAMRSPEEATPRTPLMCHMGGIDVEISPLVSKRLA